jgi:uncharacterized membrane protein
MNEHRKLAVPPQVTGSKICCSTVMALVIILYKKEVAYNFFQLTAFVKFILLWLAPDMASLVNQLMQIYFLIACETL